MARYIVIPQVQREEKAFRTHPNFVAEVRSYSNLPGNALNFQLNKMGRWISGGVRSGILFDGVGGNLYLFCRTNILDGGNHPQAAAQQNQANNEIAQLQLDIIDFQQDPYISAEDSS
eukprot:gene6394-7417_t